MATIALPETVDFKAILDAAGAMVIATDLSGVIRAFNPAAERMLGWSAAEVIGRHTPELWHVAEEAAEWAAEVSDIRGKTLPPGMETFVANEGLLLDQQRQWTYVRKDGSRFPVQLVISAIRDAAGATIGYVGTAQDLTQRVQAEQERDRFFNLSLDLFGIATPDGYFQRINPEFSKTLGWSNEEIRARPFMEFVHPDDRPATAREMEKLVVAGEQVLHFENRYRHKDGSWRVLSWRATPQPDGLIYATARDVTEHNRAEAILREAEERFRVLAIEAPVGIYLTDGVGDCTFVNQYWCDLTALTFEESLGTGWRQVVHPDDIAAAVEKWDLSAREDRAYSNELRFVRKDGEVRWVIARGSKLKDSRGRALGHVGTVLDVTERKAAEKNLREKIADLKSAHDALRTKQDLLRSLIEIQENEKQFLCHEFHDGLIQYAVGSLMLLESEQASRPPAAGSALIDDAIGNLQTGIEDGRRVIRGIRPAVLDDSGLKAAIDDLIDQYSNSGMLVTSVCDEAIGRLPESIQTAVYRVVQEALNNARKHSGTDVVRIELRNVNDWLHLEVRDFGCGFDMQAARKRGFGLLGMTERVRLLGGECTIESEPDAGTRVVVRLPMAVAVDDDQS